VSTQTTAAGGTRVEVEGVSVPLDHYIDGQRVPSDDRFEVRSPIDWENWKLADVSAGGTTIVDVAVSAARRAFPEWAARGPEKRHEILTRLADAIDAAVPDLAKVETVDNGSLYEAMSLRVLARAANNIRFFADYARDRLNEPARTLPGGERNRSDTTRPALPPSRPPGMRRSCSPPGGSDQRWRPATRWC
jgi:acyl-CoA reductase-like NAD-dependent aldehyde dehydrogenase